uniref:NADH dehydrogenase subunit 4L n=1 Tax=Ischnodemus noctulus TaxID=2969361 RepID=UPI002176BCDF|nr:NADH dehydrogenase subunit 4L [Ischnodemus noctulus]UUJ37786.1 NADH dehydrogenase subunit 4L [Ischnodemus noctulus]
MGLLMTIMFISGIFMFCSLRKHLLIVLFSIEYMVIVLFFMFFLYLMLFGFEVYFLLIFLVFSVCEGALSLSILVNLIRSHGNDYISSFSSMWSSF